MYIYIKYLVYIPCSFTLGARLRKGIRLDVLFRGKPNTVTSAPLGRPLICIFGGSLSGMSEKNIETHSLTIL